MVGALFAGIGWRGGAAIAAVITIIALVVMVRGADHAAGGAVVRDQINTSNRVSDSKADAGERDVLACQAGKWNRGKSKCEP